MSKDDFDTEAARLLAIAHNETCDTINDLTYTLTLASQTADDIAPMDIDDPFIIASCYVISEAPHDDTHDNG